MCLRQLLVCGWDRVPPCVTTDPWTHTHTKKNVRQCFWGCTKASRAGPRLVFLIIVLVKILTLWGHVQTGINWKHDSGGLQWAGLMMLRHVDTCYPHEIKQNNDGFQRKGKDTSKNWTIETWTEKVSRRSMFILYICVFLGCTTLMWDII